jgi:hypothetical protein
MTRQEDQRQGEQLSAYLDGELDAGECAAVEKRLLNDSEARAELESLRETAAAVASMPKCSAPQGLFDEVMARTADLGTESNRQEITKRGTPRRLRALTAAAAMIALMVMAGVWFMSHEEAGSGSSEGHMFATGPSIGDAPGSMSVFESEDLVVGEQIARVPDESIGPDNSVALLRSGGREGRDRAEIVEETYAMSDDSGRAMLHGDARSKIAASEGASGGPAEWDILTGIGGVPADELSDVAPGKHEIGYGYSVPWGGAPAGSALSQDLGSDKMVVVVCRDVQDMARRRAVLASIFKSREWEMRDSEATSSIDPEPIATGGDEIRESEQLPARTFQQLMVRADIQHVQNLIQLLESRHAGFRSRREVQPMTAMRNRPAVHRPNKQRVEADIGPVPAGAAPPMLDKVAESTAAAPESVPLVDGIESIQLAKEPAARPDVHEMDANSGGDDGWVAVRFVVQTRVGE